MNEATETPPQQTAQKAPAAEGDVLEAIKDVVDPELGPTSWTRLDYGARCTRQHRDPRHDSDQRGLPQTDVIEDQNRPRARPLVEDVTDRLGVDAAVGTGQGRRRRPRPAAGAALGFNV